MSTEFISATKPIEATCYIAGVPVKSDSLLQVKSPYDGRLVGTVATTGITHTNKAIEQALAG